MSDLGACGQGGLPGEVMVNLRLEGCQGPVRGSMEETVCGQKEQH